MIGLRTAVAIVLAVAVSSSASRAQTPPGQAPAEAAPESAAYERWKAAFWSHDEPIEARRALAAAIFWGAPDGIPIHRWEYAVFDPDQVAGVQGFPARWIEEARIAGDTIVPFEDMLQGRGRGYMVFMVGTPPRFVVYYLSAHLPAYMPAIEVERFVDGYIATLPAP